MRKVLLFIFVILSLSSFAQNDTTKYFNSVDYGWRYQRVKAKLALVLPVDTVANKLVGSVVLLNDVFYIKTTSAWTTLSTSISTLTLGSGLTGTSYNGSSAVTAKVDTSLISTKANVTASLLGYAPNALVVKYTDTASMLSAYYNQTATTSRLALKVNYTDTSGMLGNYIRTQNWGLLKTGQGIGADSSLLSTKANVTASLIGYAPNALVVKYTDTASMLSTHPNTTLVNSLNALNVKYTDTASMLSTHPNLTYVTANLATKLNTSDSTIANRVTSDRNFTNASLALKVNYTDTSSMLGNYVRTSNYGIIKTGQAFGVDTSAMSTKANVVALLTGYAAGATVVKYTDTASMLSTHPNKTYVDANVATKQNTITLTTTGTTGASTFNSSTGALNIPNYATGGGGISLTSLSALNPILYNNTTGVFSADTNRTVNAIATGGSLLKVRDSVYGVLNASKFNITDTALVGGTNYYNKVTVDGKLNLKVNYTDTSAMLGNYVRTSNYGITKTGQAFGVDTSALSTKANVTALLTGYAAGASVVKYSDTASMLSTHPNTTLVNSLNALNMKYTDTATALGSHYYNKTYIDANLATKGTVSSVAASVPSVLSISGSPITGSGTLAISYSGTALPIANGGTNLTALPTVAAASTYAAWDANKNIAANNFSPSAINITTSGATTTLSVSSNSIQNFTGTLAQTVVLPVVTTLTNGFQFTIFNNSSNVVTVNTSGGNLVAAMASNTTLQLTCVNTSAGTGTASWSWQYLVEGSTTPSPTTITLSGAVTGSGSSAITTSLASSVVGISNLSATGTPSSTTFLRGDNTWATPAGGGGTTTNAATFNNSGSGVTSGTTFDGSVARTISYNTIGAQPQLSGTGFVKATGTTISYDNSTYLTGAGTAGYIPYYSGAAAFSSGTGLIWNTTYNQLRVGANNTLRTDAQASLSNSGTGHTLLDLYQTNVSYAANAEEGAVNYSGNLSDGTGQQMGSVSMMWANTNPASYYSVIRLHGNSATAGSNPDFRLFQGHGLTLFDVRAGADSLGANANEARIYGTLNTTVTQNSTSTSSFSNTDVTNTNSREYVNIVAGNNTLSLRSINSGDSYVSGSNNLQLQTNGSTTALTLSTTQAATFASTVTATSLIKSGGTASQILAADGSVITAGTGITISAGAINSSGGTTTNALTMNNSGTGATSGTTFNGSAAQTISYNTIGASPLAGSTSFTTAGTITTGTWNAAGVTATAAGAGVTAIGTTGNPSYFVTDQSVNNAGKRWRVGHTGAVSGFTSFDIYDQTDAITALSLASTGQLKLGSYTTTTSFTGTGVGYLGFDASGNIITLAAGGGSGNTTNSLTFNNSNSGAASGSTFNGSAAVTVSANTVGAVALTGGIMTGGLILPQTSTSITPLQFTTGGLPNTTPVAGGLQIDGNGFLNYTHVGGITEVGVVEATQMASLTTAYTLTSQTAAQKAFNSSTNGQLTVAAGTTYYFEGFISLSSMSSTSGSFGFALGGTATLTSIQWHSMANKAALATAASAQMTVNTTNANTALATANTTTTGYMKVWGIVRINASGTIIPQVSLGVAAAAIVGVNSYFKLIPVGANTTTNIGNWN